MPHDSARAAVRALLPFALYGLARTVDAAVGLLLRTSLDLPGFVREALSLVEPASALRATLLWTAVGGAAWLALAVWRMRADRASWRDALRAEAAGFDALYLAPALTLLSLASLAVQPSYPYAFTLPVALTQDWSPARDVAILATLVAVRRPRLALPAPGAVSVGFLAFLAYALITPEPADWWANHPGNEPKTLRMAVAAGHWLTFDTERVSAGMEDLDVQPLGAAMAGAARRSALETGQLASAAMPGGAGLGADAIRATRVTRQVVRGKEGGIYTVLSPGPSALLALPLRLDRAFNLGHGTFGRVAFAVLFWNALAAALVAAVFLLLREATARPGLSAAMAGLFALLPPLVFFSFQFYPEMLGALALAVLLRQVLFVPRWTTRGCLAMGLLLATLPWLHQKFLPVWLLLAAAALVLAVDRLLRLPALLAIALPQALSGFLFVLYNFAVTGSARPDALYLAWGPRGITSARVGQGLLGLLLDARYGLLPYVPLLLLAFGGLALRGPAASRLRRALPIVLVYYVTVASADNWSGAVCNLGRYIMPVVPWMMALLAVVLSAVGGRRGVLALALMAAGWSALLARALWLDPHAANDCALLLARAAIADGNAYVPNLFIREWSDGAPGLFARIAVWTLMAAGLAAWLRRVALRGGGDSAPRVLATVFAVALAAAFALERWPSARRAPNFPDAIPLSAETVVFVTGGARVQDRAAVAGSGEVELLVRSRQPLSRLRLLLEGEGLVRLPGHAPLALRGRAVEVDVPLTPLRRLTGRRGVEETLSLQRIGVDTDGGEVRLWVISAAAAS